ncbi:hypothetical protein [Thermaerobacillus caldiproteolyticus]|nr:hypothetical protein [Anoxybacillus caldiproteolyticus]
MQNVLLACFASLMKHTKNDILGQQEVIIKLADIVTYLHAAE